jgi:hypothetical protein
MVVFSCLLGSTSAAFADAGPKPEMSFKFVFDRPGQTIANGVLLECEKANCGDAHPLAVEGPQGITCNPRTCGAVAYGFTKFAILRITFSDGRTLSSNIFDTGAFLGKYRVTVGAARLKVERSLF